jgi:hypothetical protein
LGFLVDELADADKAFDVYLLMFFTILIDINTYYSIILIFFTINFCMNNYNIKNIVAINDPISSRRNIKAMLFFLNNLMKKLSEYYKNNKI